MAVRIIFPATVFIVLITSHMTNAALDAHYYDRTCPQAERIIFEAVRNATIFDPKVPARLLRMFFHDCFIKGCDACILLDSTSGNKAEKDGFPNESVGSFDVIEDAKMKLEKACPHTVSCADIVAIAARNGVAMSGGPYWDVLKGRKDGRISRENDTFDLPSPFASSTELIQGFAQRGLGVKDLVALSGGHTLGFSHCSFFESRLHNFSTGPDVDPSMNRYFAKNLKKKCPKPNMDSNAGQFLDSTSSTFDNDFFKRLIVGKGVFTSDQTLHGDKRTKWIVKSFARDQSLFFREFVASMMKLGNVGVTENGEVRHKCNVVN